VAGPLPLRFLTSAARADQLPASTAEVAVVGRSNVGKSSLVNALANRKDLAKTSKTPGATRLINVFEWSTPPEGRWLVDLPGYGYAKVSDAERRRWQGMIEGYLTTRSTLRRILVLVDGAVGPTPLDVQTVEWLEHIGRPLLVVATKTDKVGASKRERRRRDVAAGLEIDRGALRWVSAAKGTGIAELRAEITSMLDP
jgi:GTP-binding protein